MLSRPKCTMQLHRNCTKSHGILQEISMGNLAFPTSHMGIAMHVNSVRENNFTDSHDTIKVQLPHNSIQLRTIKVQLSHIVRDMIVVVISMFFLPFLSFVAYSVIEFGHNICPSSLLFSSAILHVISWIAIAIEKVQK